MRIAADGRVKILDLGLARMVTADANATPTHDALEDARTVAVDTREGTVVGTPAYMSPEQAVGAPVGARTDVWAFGAVLFEMLSGRRAFPGATMAEILTSVLRGAVDWQALPADVPGQVRLLIERCLEHEAAGRLSDLGEARKVLRPFAGPAFVAAAHASADTKSIVVLPFANLSPDPDTEYFSDGLTDEIITDLSRIRSLRVISRSSAMRLKGDARGLAAIGRDLACPYVLEGSVRRAANSPAHHGAAGGRAERRPALGRQVRGHAGRRVRYSGARVTVDRGRPRDPAHAARGRAARGAADRTMFAPRSATSVRRARSGASFPAAWTVAISHLEAALRLIGDNVLVYQGLGVAYFQYVNIGAAIGREEEFIKKAEWCADKIFALESESPRGYLVRANVQLARGDIHGCGRSLRRVLQAVPEGGPGASAVCPRARLAGREAGRRGASGGTARGRRSAQRDEPPGDAPWCRCSPAGSRRRWNLRAACSPSIRSPRSGVRTTSWP